MQNVRRRAERDVENAHKYALDKFTADLLPVVDNLERALGTINADDETQKAVATGVELTLKSFLDVLARFNIEVVDPAGQPFDADLHQAVSMVPNPNSEPNTVIDVFQKGYTLNGRLVRPAMVVVSKAE
jgi:molecular chaperone GrpE